MAIVTGLNLEAIRSLGKVVTFKNWKELTVAQARKRKTGPPKSQAQIYTNTRFKVANYHVKTLDRSVVDLWEVRVAGTDRTWKDQFVSEFLSSWGEFNCPPMVVKKLSYAWVGDSLKLNFEFADNYLPEPNGFGNDSFGLTPFGSPLFWLDNQPFAAPAKYRFEYLWPLSRPYKTFHSSPRNPGCKKPPKPTTKEIHDVAQETPSTKEIEWSYGSRFQVTQDHQGVGTCQAIHDVAWDNFVDDPIYTDGAYIGSVVYERTNIPFVGQVRSRFRSHEITINLSWDETIDRDEWEKIKEIRFDLTWSGTADLAPWKNTVTFRGETYEMTKDDPVLILPKPAAYQLNDELVFADNKEEPPAACPPPLTQSNEINYSNPYIVWKDQYNQTENTDDDPPDEPASVRPISAITDWPIIGPILDLIFPA